MTTAEQRLQSLRQDMAELKLRVKKLEDENHDLRYICTKNGIEYEEALAAQLHRRHFARRCSEHPIGNMATASDLDPLIVRKIAFCAGSVLCLGLASRRFFAAFVKLTAEFPWRFGGRRGLTLVGHGATAPGLRTRLNKIE